MRRLQTAARNSFVDEAGLREQGWIYPTAPFPKTKIIPGLEFVDKAHAAWQIPICDQLIRWISLNLEGRSILPANRAGSYA